MTALVVVLRIEGEDVTVAPVGLDEWMADDYAIVVPASWSPLDIGFAVWIGLEAVVPIFVLDVCLGEVDVLDQIAAVGPAYRKGVSVGEAIVVGSPILDSADERSQYRHQLSLAFGSLSEAMWLDVTDGSGGHGPDSLADLLEDVDPRELAQALGLDAPSTFALMSGERLLTPEEADVIAQMVGVDASGVLAAIPSLPPGLVHELSHPYHRVAIEERARVAGHSESEERRLALRDLLPVAARRAGDEAAPLDWRRLVRDRFDG